MQNPRESGGFCLFTADFAGQLPSAAARTSIHASCLEEARMHTGVWLGLIVIVGFVAWGAVLFWRGRAEEDKPERHETRRERRRLQHKG
jgi:hypothetical protein